MRIRSLLSVFAILSFTGLGAGAATLDANHTTTDNPNNNTGLGIVNTSLAQTFTAVGSGILDSVQFSILRLNVSTTADVGFDIRNLVAGSPDPDASNALFSSSISNSDISLIGNSPYLWSLVTIDVSSANISVTTGDVLSFVLSSTIGQEFVVQTDYLNAYAGGVRWSQNGDGNAFSSNTDADLTFATYLVSDTTPVPLPASLPMLLAGVFGLRWVKRLRKAT